MKTPEEQDKNHDNDDEVRSVSVRNAWFWQLPMSDATEMDASSASDSDDE